MNRTAPTRCALLHIEDFTGRWFPARTTGLQPQPDAQALELMPHKAKPLVRALQNNGIVPNNRRWPLVIYRRALASFTTIMEAR